MRKAPIPTILALVTLSASPGFAAKPALVVAIAPLVTVETAIDGPAPDGTDDFDNSFDAKNRPGIRVGKAVYRAPWMRGTGVTGTYSGMTKDQLRYAAAVQVLALDRRTLGLIWNRTYGSCSRPGFPFECREGDNGDLIAADARAEIEALVDPQGGSPIVIVASHPNSATDGRGWTEPGALEEAFEAAGAPDDDTFHEELVEAAAGEVTLVGVAGLEAGRANYAIAPVRGPMRGYMQYNPESARYDGYVPSARVPFDTRASVTPTDGGVSVTMTVGARIFTGEIDGWLGGYLVTSLDANTLDGESHVFVTAGCGPGDQGNETACQSNTRRMAALLENENARVDRIVMISSIETPGQQPSAVTADFYTSQNNWIRLSKAVAALGGTRHVFNKTASETNRTYSLVGFSGAGEGGGKEAVQQDLVEARVRGAFVPNGRSLFRPRNVNTAVQPPERLLSLHVKEPSPGDGWPGTPGGPDYTPRRARAIAYVGSKVPQLGSDPRRAYWADRLGSDRLTGVPDTSASNLIPVISAISQKSSNGPGDVQPFTTADLEWAKAQLIKELGWVSNVRLYIYHLGWPVDTARQQNDQAVTAQLLAEQLQQQLDEIDENAEFAFQVAEGVASVFSLGGFVGAANKHVAAGFLEVLAGVYEACVAGADGAYTSKTPNLRLNALQLAQALTDQEDEVHASFRRLGDAIVADYIKLAEVGTWGGCDPTGCLPPYEEYAYPTDIAKTASTLATRALVSSIYAHLVPLAFPVWDTGFATSPAPAGNFWCPGNFSPFSGAPAAASARLFDELDPGDHTATPDNPDGPRNRDRTFVMTHRQGIDYSWPEQEILDRMFGAVVEDEWNYVEGVNGDKGGLGMSPEDFMRAAWARGDPTRFEPGVTCDWYMTFSPDYIKEPGPK